MKKTFFLLLIILFPGISRGQVYIEDDFERYYREQKAAFNNYAQNEDKKFKAYYDSINQEFAKYLAEAWPDYSLKKKEPPIVKPVPPTVYKPDTPQPKPIIQPVKEVPKPTTPDIPSKDEESGKSIKKDLSPKIPISNATNSLNMIFYGTPVAISKVNYSLPHLTGIDEPSVAKYWNALTKLPYTDWTEEIKEKRTTLNLNDWGMYILINQTFKTKFPGRNSNEQTAFVIFLLNQLGYKAKIGRSQQELIPLIAFKCNVFNSSFFKFGNTNGTIYTVLNPKHGDLSSIKSCGMEFKSATRLMDMSLSSIPSLQANATLQPLKAKDQSYNVWYDKNYMQMLSTYQCVDFKLYAESVPSETFLKSVEEELRPLVKNKSQEESINALLHFVQYAFKYKTDDEQFGYERWFFPEETIASSYSDCEDRAILFSQLVRHLLGMEVALVYYTGKHLATAVRFDNPNTSGDYLNINGKKFLICDPTYIGAPLGKEMPNLKNSPKDILRREK